MRPLLTIVLFVVFVFCMIRADGQTCSGSLGDPIFNETFGRGDGPRPGPQLPPGVTSLSYTNNNCGGDGDTYALLSQIASACKGATWQAVSQDHTGDTNGLMMVINASSQPSLFYTTRISGSLFCPGAVYEFGVYAANILRNLPSTAGYIEPNITFTVEKADGTPLAQPVNSGDIPAVGQSDIGLNWKQYGTLFTAPTDGSDVIIKMTNNAFGDLGNDFAIDDITIKPCGAMIFAGFNGLTDTTSKSVCYPDPAQYTFEASALGYANPQYQWQMNNGNGWANIPGATGTELTRTFPPATTPGTYQFRVGILGDGKTSPSCQTFSKPLNVIINPFPTIAISLVTPVCAGKQLILSAYGADTYHWTGPNGFVSDEETPLVTDSATATVAGTYTLYVIARGCRDTVSTQVTIAEDVNPTISNAVSICQGDSTQLQAGGGMSYLWTPSTGLDNPNIANPKASPASTTTYFVKVSNQACSYDGKSVTVTVKKRPTANAGRAQPIMEGQSEKLLGIAGGDDVSYHWTPTTGLDDPNSLTPNASPTENTTYTLHVTSASCGEDTSSVSIHVFKKLIIPNTFSPNNDGINDIWNIKNLNTYSQTVLTVFDRDGQQVYKSSDYSKPWDGTYGGRILPAGTYYYVIDFNRQVPNVSGWVFLAR